MNKIKVGKVTSVVGLKGQIKVYPYTEYKEGFEEWDTIYLDEEKYTIKSVRYQKNMVVLKLDGIDHIDHAQAQRGKELFIGEEELKPLPKGTYYVKDLLGFPVITQEGETLGVLTDILQNTAQDLYEVELENKKKILIPLVDEFILEINDEEKFIKVRLIEGLLDL
ncbi:MAG: ribosome maturation factor RimM [Anaerovoracaceae bacterium]